MTESRRTRSQAVTGTSPVVCHRRWTERERRSRSDDGALGTTLALSCRAATVHGEESVWLRALVGRRVVALGAYSAVLAGVVIGLAVYDGRLAVAVLVAGMAFARRRTGLVRRLRYATQGMAGELETAKMLALLPAGFTVLNDLAFSGFNVDHVVVGPSGVWAVETKSQPGVVEERADGVRLNGRPMHHDPRRQARGCAATVAELLERETGRRWWVEALVYFPNAIVTGNESQAEARIVGRGQLLGRLRLAPKRLVGDERDRLVSALKQAKARTAA